MSLPGFLFSFLFFPYFLLALGLHCSLRAFSSRGQLRATSCRLLSLWCMGFSLRWLPLLWSTGSGHMGFSSCSMWAQYLWHTGLVVRRHVESSWTRDQTCVPCVGRQIPIHCITGKSRFLEWLHENSFVRQDHLKPHLFIPPTNIYWGSTMQQALC